MKLTAKRQMVYDILKTAKKPQSADDIYMILKDTMNLSTVYRTLEKFHQDALVSRNYLDNTAYYYLNEAEHHHFMVCDVCHKKYAFDCHVDGLIDEVRQKYGFEVLHHDLNLYGTCQSCQS